MTAAAVAELCGLLSIKTDARSVELARQALAKLTADTDKATNTAKLSAALAHVHGDASKAAKLIGLNYDAAGASAAKATSWAARWGKALVVINQGLEVAGKLYGAVKSGIDGIVSAVRASAAQANQALDLSQRLGIAVEDVQRLGYAAGQSSTNLDELAGGLGKLANTLDNAKKGGKEAAAALHAVGLSKADAGKPLDENLNAIADAFARLPDGARKAALASDLFGQSGVRLIPFLNKGREGIGALKDEADKLGVVIDGKTAGALQGFGDATDRLHQTIAGVRNQVVAALLPSIVALVNGAQQWIAANRQMVSEALIAGGRVLLGVVQALVVALRVGAEVMAFFGRHATLTKALLVGLAVVGSVVAVSLAAAFTFVMAPVLALGAVIVGIMKLLPVLGRAARATGRVFVEVWDSVKAGAASVWSALSAMGDATVSVFRGAYDWIAGKVRWLSDIVDAIVQKYEDVKGAIFGHSDKSLATHAGETGWRGEAGRMAAARLGAPATASIPAAGRGGLATPTGVTVTAPITINAKTGASADEIGKAVGDHLQGAIREAHAGLGGRKK